MSVSQPRKINKILQSGIFLLTPRNSDPIELRKDLLKYHLLNLFRHSQGRETLAKERESVVEVGFS